MKQLVYALIIGVTFSAQAVIGNESGAMPGSAPRSGADPVRASLAALSVVCCMVPYALGLQALAYGKSLCRQGFCGSVHGLPSKRD